ncbi:MAG: tRNA (N(6)-L-threonylcarbamoyladenosine(37)-C(2))-methylthiotransferase MtaB [Saprospiraceae bacterium]|nr:tRNA (N(6)-L-threonylcarbamoyladenosine(37)-C(2))-methylthiotransferase MtaB [Saprospiraceae bacterium]
MSTGRKIAFHTLGCKLNFSETSGIGQQFKSAGYEEVDFDQEADIYVINTCSVTELADKKCRKSVRQAVKNNPDAKVIVMGCYAQLKPQEIASIPGVDLVLGASEKFNLMEHLQKLDQTNNLSRVIMGGISEVNHFVPSYSIEDRTRTFLKVQDGCDYKCSFCTIPLARGRSRSGEINELLRITEEIAAKGVKEIVLTGVNLGDFGNGTEVIEGQKPKKNELFIDLARALDHMDVIPRFRISSIEPNLCTQDLIDFVADSKHFMPHFHMPLQSGDNEILSLMKRRYKRELYADKVLKIKSAMPHACIGADVIIGFPGETETHFQNTLEFLHQLELSYLHVFTYSERINTPAIGYSDSVPMSVRAERSIILRNLSEKKKNYFYSQFIGTKQKVLIERNPKHAAPSHGGFTENYLRVLLNSSDENLINQILTVKIKDFSSNGDLLAEIEN